jgi:hypothetical protein
MPVYLITWDLNKEKLNYNEARKRFFERLDKYDHIKDPDLDSVVFISSNIELYKIADDLLKVMDKDDRVIITKLNTNQYAGRLLTKVVNWIESRV